MFSYVIDFEIISDLNEIYENETWAEIFEKSFKENFDKMTFI